MSYDNDSMNSLAQRTDQDYLLYSHQLLITIKNISMFSQLNSGRLLESTRNQAHRLSNSVASGSQVAMDKWNSSSTVTKSVVLGGTMAVAAPCAIIPILSAIGFTSTGVAAGSIAASSQTATTASGSLFALCQSAGAVGSVAASTSAAIGAAAGGLTATTYNFVKHWGQQNSVARESNTTITSISSKL